MTSVGKFSSRSLHPANEILEMNTEKMNPTTAWLPLGKSDISGAMQCARVAARIILFRISTAARSAPRRTRITKVLSPTAGAGLALWGAAVIPLLGIERMVSFDPAELVHVSQMIESATVYETVLGYRNPGTTELEPRLLERLPARLDGGRRYRMTVKKGVRFESDSCLPGGRELVADDVVYSWKRLLDPSQHFAGAWALRDLVGPEGVRKVGPRDVEVLLPRASATFLYRLAMPGAAIVARECVEHYGKDFGRHPVGTGAFRFIASKSDFQSRLFYEARRDYHGPGLPRPQAIDVRIFLEAQPRWLNFESGAVAKIGLPKESISSAQANSKLWLRQQMVPNVLRVSFNMDSSVVGAKAPRGRELRAVISRLLDRSEYVKLFLGGQGEEAYGPVPPGVVGYAPGIRSVSGAARPTAKVTRLDPPVELEMNAFANANWRQFADWVALKVAPAGIVIKPVFLRESEWRARAEKRQGDLWAESWNADYPDAENFLQLYYGKNRSPGSNDSGYSDAEFDRLYEQLLVTDGAKAREALSLKMQKILRRDQPAVWLAHEKMLIAYHARGGDRKNGPKLKDHPHPFDFSTRRLMELEP